MAADSTSHGASARPALDRDVWPALPLDAWEDTYQTLHRYCQIVGKTRLSLAAPVNHWWHVPLYVSARGLSTSPIPYRALAFEVEFDFIDQALVVRTCEGATSRLALTPRSVADFYREYRAMLQRLDIPVRIFPRPVEMMDALPFAEDHVHAAYDPDAAYRCWQVLRQVARVLEIYRGRFLGKASPVHFFWGGFDLAYTRFSGRPAPPHPGGIPNVGNHVMHEAYSHECISAGWWPGGGPVREAMFYSYAYPEPAGFPTAQVRPAEAYYHGDLREFVLPYEAVRTNADPDAMLLAFFQSVYERGAELGKWKRAELERASG